MGIVDFFRSFKSNFSNEIYYYEDADSKKQNKYQLNSYEKTFLDGLKTVLLNNRINKNIRYGFLSNGTMYVCLDGIGQIGRVKLRGRKFRMQIMHMSDHFENQLDVTWIENITFDECIVNISRWIDFVKNQK